MRRFGLLIATALLFAAVGSASAWACVDPGIGVSPDPAHPGDPVYYTITDMRSGAWYEVKAGNDVVVSRRQTQTNDPVKGSFPMPDIGPSATPVSVQVIVEHGDIDNENQTLAPPSPYPIRYAGYAQPAPEPTATQAPTQDGSTSPDAVQPMDAASPVPTQPKSEFQRASGTRSPRGGSGRAPRPAARNHVSTQPQAARAHQRVSERREIVGAPPSVEPVTLTRVVRRAMPRVRVRPHRLAEPVAVPLPEVAAIPHPAIPHPARPPVQQPEAARDYAFFILAIALGVAIAMMRRRGWGGRPAERSPSPCPLDVTGVRNALAMEAELQEIIAEEKARAERELSGVP